MLQYITDDRSPISIADQARLAIEGGCRWIQLAVRGSKTIVENLSDGSKLIDIEPADKPAETDLKAYVEEITPLCKETESFLVIEDDVDLVDEVRVHGVFLSDKSREIVAATRERLGAHAIIGVAVDSVEDALSLKGLDIDYVTFRLPVTDDTADRMAAIVKEIRDAGIDFHIVAEGEFPSEMLPKLLAAGAAGVAMSERISRSDNPKAVTAEIIGNLKR